MLDADVSARDADPIASYALAILRNLESRGGNHLRVRLPSLALEVTGEDRAYLAAIGRALVDAPVYASGPQMRLVLATGASDVPPPPRAAVAEAAHVASMRLVAAGLRGSFDWSHGIVQVYDPRRGLGVQLSIEGRYAPWEASFPLRNFLHWHYEAMGMRLVHAATLGDGNVGLLLAGEGGSGKSGTTLAGAVNGLVSVGDDYVLLGWVEARPMAWPVARLMKQDAAGLHRVGLLPEQLGAVGPNWQQKFEFEQPEASRCHQLPLSAIVLPRITDGRCRTTHANGREAMLALAPSNLRQLPGSFEGGLGFIANLVRTLPAFHLDLSSDPAEIVAALRGVIKECGR